MTVTYTNGLIPNGEILVGSQSWVFRTPPPSGFVYENDAVAWESGVVFPPTYNGTYTRTTTIAYVSAKKFQYNAFYRYSTGETFSFASDRVFAYSTDNTGIAPVKPPDIPNVFPGYNITKVYQEGVPVGLGYSISGTFEYYLAQFLNVQIGKLGLDKPNYLNFVIGYKPLDNRDIPNYPIITLDQDTDIKIKYYQHNPLESIPSLTSIEWRVYHLSIKQNIPTELPIYNCVLGTLSIDVGVVSTLVNALSTPNDSYAWADLFIGSMPNLMDTWLTLYNADNQLTAGAYVYPENRLIRIIGANNNYWDNRVNSTEDFNPKLDHPMFLVDSSRAFEWHLSPQNEGIGTLIMDSPRTIETRVFVEQLAIAFQAQDYQSEDLTADPPVHFLDWYLKNIGGKKIDQIHAALDAETWGVNPLDPKKIRVDNLGWRINRANEVLGIRVKPNGKIDEALEKTTNRRLHAEGSESNDPQKYGINGFGSEGMMVRVLPNKFSPNGTVSGGYCKVKDIPQLFAEFHEQANAAMGYQEGTAIEIQLDGQTYRYPNQLALMTELLITAKQTATYSKGAFFSSLIGEQSIKEVMGGLGLRTVDRFLEFKVAGKTVKLYYKGISASQSIRRKLSAIATNIGTVIGNII